MEQEQSTHEKKGALNMRALIAVPMVVGIIFVVPIIIYGAFSQFGLASMPGDSPIQFLAGVLVSKIGTALAFVVLFVMASTELRRSWPGYALIWFAMFALEEIGQAIGPNYPWSEAVAGIVSEAIYLPLSAFMLSKVMHAVQT